MKKIAFMLSLFFSFNVYAANIKATVENAVVPIDEIFTLTLSADENVADTPDLSVLTPDFNVYSKSLSTSIYVVNGKRNVSTKWKIGISANKDGEQKIPPIKVGKDFSNEVDIKVLPAGEQVVDTNEQEKADYKIKTEIDEYREWYLQEQIPYNVVITDIGGLQGGEPVFDSSSDWIIKSLGTPDVVSKNVNGQNVREIIFKYVLFAQKSGKLKIPAVRFNGYALSNDGGGIFINNAFNFNLAMPSFGFNVPVNLVGQSRSVDIKPVPENYKGSWWLPAKSVEIRADFVGENNFVEGEAFSREITLTAVGVIDTQLPDITFANSSDLKQYPQKGVSSNEIIDNEPVAIKKVVNVYIPEKTGEIILPEISVEWFDVTTQKIKKATVKEQKIFVKANPNLKDVAEVKINSDMPVAVTDIKTVDNNKTINMMQMLSVAIGTFLLGLFLGYYIFKCRNNNVIKPQCENRTYPDFIVKKAMANDYRGLRDALISWATGFYPDKQINTLKDIALAAEDDCFSKQIEIITAKLYSPKDEQIFDAKVFNDAYKRILKQNKKKKNISTVLPNLYE